MKRLIATKAMRYATRRLLPDDEFVASPRDARLLIAIGKARAGEEIVVREKKPAAKAGDATAHLRAEYSRVIGKKPFNGWDDAELQRRIDEASAS